MPEETRCWTDLATDNARLRAVNAKLLDALRSVTIALARREGMSMAVVVALAEGRWHETAPQIVPPVLEEARAALAAAEGDA